MVTLRKLVENKKELEEAGRGRPSKTTLAQAIDKVEDKAEEINAEDNIIVDGKSNSGVIEDNLDRVLKVNKRINRTNGDDFVNVMFVGGAGVGKSSRIRAWAEKNNINLYEVRAAGMDDTDLGGAITPDKEGKTVNRLASTEFDVLDRPNSVLFLDEYNRAPGSVRTNLLELVNSHLVPDPREPSGQRKLKGFLFTIAAINPADVGYNTDSMDRAEKGRFEWIDVPAEKPNLNKYLKYYFNNQLKQAEADKDEEWAKQIKGQIALADALLTSEEFKFDNKKDEEDSEEKGNGLGLNPRTLHQLLKGCDGTKDNFLELWNRYCNSLKKPTVERILKDYKDIDDIANDALKGHDTQSDVFKKEEDNYSKVMKLFGDAN